MPGSGDAAGDGAPPEPAVPTEAPPTAAAAPPDGAEEMEGASACPSHAIIRGGADPVFVGHARARAEFDAAYGA